MNCEIAFNASGMSLQAGRPFSANSLISQCNFNNNGTALLARSNNAQITQCDIEYNNIGILLEVPDSNIYCNKICNNTTYGLQMSSSSNVNVSNNYWCTNDSSLIEAAIYDGYDNVTLGLVIFIPVDLAECSGIPTKIPNYKDRSLPFSIFPNPATDNLTIELPTNNSKTEIKIFNVLGALAYSSTVTKQKTDIDVSTLSNGIYIVQITAGNKIERQKFIRQ